MTTEQSLSISEALTHFVAAKKSSKSAQQSHQELGRFVAWVGRERKVSELSPSEVAEYAPVSYTHLTLPTNREV